MRCCETGPSVASPFQRSHYATLMFQLGKCKPPDFNTTTEEACSKQGEETELLALFSLLQGNALLPTAAPREMFIYGSCFLYLVPPSVRLHYTCPVSGGNESHLALLLAPCHRAPIHQCHCAVHRAVVFVYILKGRECPHLSGQARCNFRERKGLASTSLAGTHGVYEREGI